MNIRQNCIFSFEDALKMQPKSKLAKVINTLDLDPVLTKLNIPDKGKSGPKPYPVYAMLNALNAPENPLYFISFGLYTKFGIVPQADVIQEHLVWKLRLYTTPLLF
jgi:hypothetical protein